MNEFLVLYLYKAEWALNAHTPQLVCGFSARRKT